MMEYYIWKGGRENIPLKNLSEYRADKMKINDFITNIEKTTLNLFTGEH